MAYAMGLVGSSVDTVLCTFVLEHLEDPQRLRPGGSVILSVPLIWHQ